MAVVAMVAVKEAALLLTVQRQVRGVDVEHDLLGCGGMSVQGGPGASGAGSIDTWDIAPLWRETPNCVIRY